MGRARGGVAMSYRGLRDLAKDGDLFTFAATVELHENETTHYFVNEEGDIVVSVVAHNGMPAHANLGALVGSRGQGVWCIPELGTEVLIGTDRGDVEGECYLIGAFGAPPEGLAPGKVLIIGLEIEARSANGTAVKLAKASELQAHIAWTRAQFSASNGHIHVVAGAATTTMTTVPAPAITPPSPSDAPTAPGTDVLKGE